jgi:hypothetical protein
VTCTGRAGCASGEICHAGRCLAWCYTDLDCPSDGFCYQGVCYRQTFRIDAPEPNAGATQRRPLRAGAAAIDLDIPVGVSMAGFGLRTGPVTPYRDALGGSTGMYDRPRAHALVLDDGVERVVLLRLPLCWSTDFLISVTAKKLADQLGEDYLRRIITSAHHSHSDPARFWRILPNNPELGVFGQDSFSPEIVDRLTNGFAAAIATAVADLDAATFGWTWVEPFDPQDRISSDRRGENPRFKEDRVLLMEVRRAGKPIAIAVVHGLHGVISEDTMITGDAPEGVERALEAALEAEAGSDVVPFFLQGAVGDMSPRADDLGHAPVPRMQVVGQRFWEAVRPLRERLTFSSDVRMGLSHVRVPVDRAHLGYADGEFFDRKALGGGEVQPFRAGAFQCVQSGDEDPATRWVDGDLQCVFAVEYVNRAPVAQSMKARMSALSFGEDLVLLTLPGEPVSRLAVDLAERVKREVGYGHAAVLGLAQDHHLYLTPEDDWFQGGYEAAQSVWGWRMGTYLAGEAFALAQRHAAGERGEPESGLKPAWWPDVDFEERVTPTVTAAGRAGAIVQAPPESVRRLDVIEMRWTGGHPGVDLPRVVLQRQDGAGAWVDVLRPSGRPYEGERYETVLSYHGDYEGDHTWGLTWEESEVFPVGRYRLRVAGRAWDGAAAVPYEAGLDAAFELVPAGGLIVEVLAREAVVEGLRVRGSVAYPAAAMEVPRAEGGEVRPLGHRLRSAVASTFVPYPLDVTRAHEVHVESGAASATVQALALGVTDYAVPFRRRGADLEPRTFHGVPRSEFEVVVPGGDATATVRVRVTDAFGNTGVIDASP